MSGTTTIASLPVAGSVPDSDLIIVEEVGSPNVTKRATAAQMRATSVPIAGGTMTGGLTIAAGGLTVTGTGAFTDTVTMDAGGGWSSSNVGKQALITTPAGVSNPAIGITDNNGANLFAIWNNAGTLRISAMPDYGDSVTAPTNIAAFTSTAVTLSKATTISTGGLTISAGGATVTGNSKITGTLETTGALTVDAGGALVTGNSKITGTLETTGKLTVDANGIAVTGNSTITGTLGGLTGLTVASGGGSITGALTVSTAGTSGNQVVNFSQFAQTLGSTGTLSFPGGLILKWGSGTTGVGGTDAVTFAAAFPSAIYGAAVQPVAATALCGVVSSAGLTTAGFSLATFLSTTGAGQASAYFWWAWGS